MAEPFKKLINPALVRVAAGHLSRSWGDFDVPRFESLATHGLEALELKARAMQVADALEATLPNDFDRAASVLEGALAPAETGDNMAGLALADEGLRGWILWSAGEFVARRGIADPTRALQALHAFTQRFTAEFAIRPLIVAHPALVFTTLTKWTADPSAHVRRSVANHLNDIAKDHPALVADWLETHLPEATAARRALLRHASRTLIKKGDRRVLTAWGLGARFAGSAALSRTPRRVAVGDSLSMTLTLRSTSRRTQKLAIDYVVHHVRSDGTTSPKVFKGWTVDLKPQAELQLTKRHSLRRVTTRRYHAGRHVIEVNVNGGTVASAAFTLSL